MDFIEKISELIISRNRVHIPLSVYFLNYEYTQMLLHSQIKRTVLTMKVCSIKTVH